MHTHDKVENVLYRLKQMLSVININIEFTFNCIVNKYASSNVKILVFIVPVSLKCYWNTIPSVWIDVSQSITNYTDNTLGKYMWFLI